MNPEIRQLHAESKEQLSKAISTRNLADATHHLKQYARTREMIQRRVNRFNMQPILMFKVKRK